MRHSEKEKKFEKYLDVVTAELFDAKYQSRLYWKIYDSNKEYNREINQTIAFWRVILKSLETSSVLSLARVYDQRKDSIHLKTFIDLIGDNIHIFHADKFKQRLKDNKYCDSLAKDNRIPSEEQLNRDKYLVSQKDPLVNKLIMTRNNIIAHRNEGQILGHKKAINVLTWEEFNKLVERGFEIRNRYSSLYNASTYAADALVQKDDYKYVFQYLRIAKLALDFVNRNSTSVISKNFTEITKNFIEEVRKEIYKKF